jgi:FtsH-binding integral membrane protein
VIVSYLAYLANSAWQFARRPEQRRTVRGITYTLVPVAILVALVGVLAASVNAFTGQQGTPSTPWALVLTAFGLAIASLLLATEGLLLRGHLESGSKDRRAVGTRSLSLIATTVPLVLLGGLFLAFATCRLACA